ncbi:MAG: hypothetical protein FWE32_08470 [Oscillospiraceae bacterium]|nr:hypothetical protein [Oscillospiraceae bacterium]
MLIEGNVRFDVNRTGAVSSAAPFPSVPVALKGVHSGMCTGAITRTGEGCCFDSVPSGEYAATIYWGCPVAVPLLTGFDGAVQGGPAASATPPATALVSPPTNATHFHFEFEFIEDRASAEYKICFALVCLKNPQAYTNESGVRITPQHPGGDV